MSVPDGTRLSPEGLDRLEAAVGAYRAFKELPGGGDDGSFGRFRLRGVLGQGRFGIVFLAEDPLAGREVALKVPQPSVLSDPALAARFGRDVEAAAHLDHPGIVPVLEAGTVGRVAYIVLPYVPGPTLAAWLAARREPVPVADAVGLLLALAEAVQHAHERGVLHCDLKPSNVLLSRRASALACPAEEGKRGRFPGEYEPRITDFGLARLLGRPAEETLTTLAAGTPPYLAPEQARGTRRDLTARCDVHALAAMLYELLTGRTPYHADNAAERVRQLVDPHCFPTPPRAARPDLPRDLEAIVLKGLEKEPARRYVSAQALADDLRRFRDGLPTRARPVGPLGLALRWARRRPGGAALAGACAVVTVLLGLLILQANELRQAGRETELQEFHAALERVRQRRLEQADGWADDNLEDLRRLATKTPAGDNLPWLRSEAAAALALPRLRLVRELGVGKNAYVCAFSPDGDTLALGERYPTKDSVLRVWLVRATGESVRELTYPADVAWEKRHRNKRADGARSLAFSPDRRWLVLGTRGGRLVRWDLRERAPKATAWDAHAGDGNAHHSHDEVRSLVFHRDGSVMASASVGRHLRRWDVGNGWTGLDHARYSLPIGTPVVRESAVIELMTDKINLHRLDLRTGQLGPPIPSPVTERFCQSPVGERLAATSNSFLPNFWLGRVGERLEQLTLINPAWLNEPKSAEDDLAFAACGRWVYATSQERATLVVWDAIQGTPAVNARLRGGSARLAVARSGPFVAVCSEGRTLLFERQDSPIRRDLAEAGSVGTFALSGDGERLVTIAATPFFWDHATGTEERARRALYGRVGNGFRWLRQERVPVNGISPGTAALGPTGKGGALASSALVPGGAGVVTHDGNGIATGRLNDLQFGPDEAAWAATKDGKLLRLAGKAGPNVIASIPPDPDNDDVVYTCVRPGAHSVLAGRSDGKVEGFGANGERLGAWDVFADQEVSAIAVRGDGTEALVGGSRGSVARLSLPSGEVARPAEPLHKDAVLGLAYLDNGATLTASADHAVRLWDVRDRLLLTLREAGPIARIDVSPQGELFLLVRGEWGLRVWDLAELRERLMDLGLEPGYAVARKVSPAAAPLTGLMAELFKGIKYNFLVERRRDPNIDFNWGEEPPSPFLEAKNFSIRWTGSLRAPTPGRWKIHLDCDHSASVWIDGRHAIQTGTTSDRAVFDLPAHPVSIRVDYQAATGPTRCRLLWRPADEPVVPVPIPPEAFTPD